MSNRPKGHALKQRDPYRVPRKPAKPHRGEPDGGTGGDTEGAGALFWTIVFLLSIWLIFR